MSYAKLQSMIDALKSLFRGACVCQLLNMRSSFINLSRNTKFNCSGGVGEASYRAQGGHEFGWRQALDDVTSVLVLIACWKAPAP